MKISTRGRYALRLMLQLALCEPNKPISIKDIAAKQNISVFFISQASSETGISFGLKLEDADRAKALIDEEFSHEIKEGAILPVRVDKELATVAVVGESMIHNPGVAGKLFSILVLMHLIHYKSARRKYTVMDFHKYILIYLFQ